MSEPVTTDSQRFVRSLWMLDRDLAYSRHYPAVSWTGSFARDTDELGSWHAANGQPGWASRRARAVALLAEADRLAELAEIIGQASLPGHEQVLLLGGRLLRDGVLMQNALNPNDGFCSADKGPRCWMECSTSLTPASGWWTVAWQPPPLRVPIFPRCCGPGKILGPPTGPGCGNAADRPLPRWRPCNDGLWRPR
ncbi:hypothetical protein NHF46_07825 [Arthrobacter alpinus]|nr:hypothetical protein [Arthrobacter alpinus]